jgi:hypothetical protein
MDSILNRTKARLIRVQEGISEFFSNEEISEERFTTCKDCYYYMKKTLQCGQCKCFMPIKILLKNSTCPDDRWRQ